MIRLERLRQEDHELEPGWLLRETVRKGKTRNQL